MRKYILLLFIMFAFAFSNAYSRVNNNQGIDAAGLSFYTPISLAYDGATTYPGIKINIEKFLKTTQRSESGSELSIGLNGGYYGRTDYHTAFYLNALGLARYSFKNGFVAEAELNIGAMKRIRDEVEKQKFFNDFGATGAFLAGIGADLYKATNVPLILKLRGGIIGMYPTNEEEFMPLMEINFTYLFGKTFM